MGKKTGTVSFRTMFVFVLLSAVMAVNYLVAASFIRGRRYNRRLEGEPSFLDPKTVSLKNDSAPVLITEPNGTILVVTAKDETAIKQAATEEESKTSTAGNAESTTTTETLETKDETTAESAKTQEEETTTTNIEIENVTSTTTTQKSKRKFISYTSSEWEQIWLNNVDHFQETKEICWRMKTEHQMKYMHDFLNLTCTHRYAPPHEDWCMIDDKLLALWYNTAVRNKYELHWENPLPADAQFAPGGPHAVVPGPEHEHIVSKFVFLDETTGEKYAEYIEPLVSHLRFPLAKCVSGMPETDKYKYHGTIFRGWVIPPPPTLRQDKKILFDAGASDWFHGAGGPSLNYFFQMWRRHDIEFDDIYAFEMTTRNEDFYKTVPEAYVPRTHYQQCAVSSQPEEHSDIHPFLPILIKEKAAENDYTLFKLDIDSPQVENGNIDYILSHDDLRIDEIAWEHHISGNYLMTDEWGDPNALDQVSLRGSYEYYLKMRQKGIRAHSWV